MWVVVVLDHTSTILLLIGEDHLHVAVCGGGVVPPQTLGPLHRDDDPSRALPGRAAVRIHGLLVVALADAGVPGVALDPGAAGLAAVPPQALLQDVVADGGAEVLPGGIFDRHQLVERVQRVRNDVGVLWDGAQPLFVG